VGAGTTATMFQCARRPQTSSHVERSCVSTVATALPFVGHPTCGQWCVASRGRLEPSSLAAAAGASLGEKVLPFGDQPSALLPLLWLL
jgi:hypothetical protein